MTNVVDFFLMINKPPVFFSFNIKIIKPTPISFFHTHTTQCSFFNSKILIYRRHRIRLTLRALCVLDVCLVFVTERRMKIILLLLHFAVSIENAEERLITTLLESYNKEIRPIRNVSEIIQVRFIMTLQQMISVIEKV